MKKYFFLVVLGIALALAWVWYSGYSMLATPEERNVRLPGDELIPNAIGSVTHAITIERLPHNVWPWLAQMGSDRGGWYAYDFIDNGGHPSAQRILTEFQDVKIGTVFPALPGAKDVFTVVQCQPAHFLVLSWQPPGGGYFTTWAFVLQELTPGRTRLLVRGRAGPNYRPFGLPPSIAPALGSFVHGVMQRKQLLGIKQRVEANPI